MSDRLFANDVLFLQRLLSCCGLYADKLDGDYGKNTGDAEAKFDAKCQAIAQSEGAFDARSEGNIRSLQLVSQPLARRSLKAFKAAGLDARIISGRRGATIEDAKWRSRTSSDGRRRVGTAVDFRLKSSKGHTCGGNHGGSKSGIVRKQSD